MLYKQGFCDQVKAERLELRDKDSVIIRERTVHDTVYLTKEVYRDRLKATGEMREVVRTDTVVVTEWREKIIEKALESAPQLQKRDIRRMLGDRSVR